MDPMRKTAIIVPCYNEAERLDPTAFLTTAAEDPGLHFIFVDDGSTDGTAELLLSLESANPDRISFVGLEKNRGKAEAVRQGFLEALETDFINIGYWDADLATPLHVINKFCRILDGSDTIIVIGSRVRLLGRKIERLTARHYLGRIFATFSSLILKIHVYDTQCGAKIFKRTTTLKLAFKEPFRVKWIFDVELLARLLLIERAKGSANAGESWVEYPLEEWTDVKGSKVGYTDFISAAMELFKIFALLYIPGLKQRYAASLTGCGEGRK